LWEKGVTPKEAKDHVKKRQWRRAIVWEKGSSWGSGRRARLRKKKAGEENNSQRKKVMQIDTLGQLGQEKGNRKRERTREGKRRNVQFEVIQGRRRGRAESGGKGGRQGKE